MNAVIDITSAIIRRGSHLIARPWSTTKKGHAAITSICDELAIHHNDAFSQTLSDQFFELYENCSQGEMTDVFQYLLENHSPAPVDVLNEIDKYWLDASPENAQRLHAKCEAPRQRIFRALNSVPNGLSKLIRMRSDLLDAIREQPGLKVVDRDLHHVLASGLSGGILELRKIDWDSPAAILEQLIRYESVHEIADWSDLRRRLEEDRRCYGFFHPLLGDDVLIFIEVALTTTVADSVTDLLNSAPNSSVANEATTAVFYSINNCQLGLRGISFGDLLIKRVVNALKSELPGLTTFVTLSPIPRFREWLEAGSSNTPRKETGEQQIERTKDYYLEACAQYLVSARTATGEVFDPVARFHLGNGAVLHRLNWNADASEKGADQSLGIMVNYLYPLDELEQNHAAFHFKGEVRANGTVTALFERSELDTQER